VYGVTFKIKRSLDNDTAAAGGLAVEKKPRREASSSSSTLDDSSMGRETVLLSCYGIGYSNVNRRVT